MEAGAAFPVHVHVLHSLLQHSLWVAIIPPSHSTRKPSPRTPCGGNQLPGGWSGGSPKGLARQNNMATLIPIKPSSMFANRQRIECSRVPKSVCVRACSHSWSLVYIHSYIFFWGSSSPVFFSSVTSEKRGSGNILCTRIEFGGKKTGPGSLHLVQSRSAECLRLSVCQRGRSAERWKRVRKNISKEFFRKIYPA